MLQPKRYIGDEEPYYSTKISSKVKSPIHASIAIKNHTVHEGIKPFHCNICDYKSSVKSDIT